MTLCSSFTFILVQEVLASSLPALREKVWCPLRWTTDEADVLGVCVQPQHTVGLPPVIQYSGSREEVGKSGQKELLRIKR